MGHPARKLTTFEEYLELEHDSDIKHELVDGEIYAMAGASPRHNLLCANVIIELGVSLRGHPCKVYTADQRVRALATNLTTYPDVSVVCGPFEADPADSNTLLNPSLLVEVLSPSTELYDRRTKLRAYQQLPSLKHYLLVESAEIGVDHYERTDLGWLYRHYGPGDVIRVLGVEISVDELYAGWTPPVVEPPAATETAGEVSEP